MEEDEIEIKEGSIEIPEEDREETVEEKVEEKVEEAVEEKVEAKVEKVEEEWFGINRALYRMSSRSGIPVKTYVDDNKVG
jgi:hypothetical protein